MLKKIIVFSLVFIFILSSISLVSAEVMPIKSLEAPKNLSLRKDGESIIDLRWTNPASVMKVIEDESDYSGSLSYLVDWKENDGQWHTAITSKDPNFDDAIHGQFYGNLGSHLLDDENVMETFFVIWHLFPEKSPADTYDLVNNTYYFRMRYILESYDDEFAPVYSPYSEVAAIGKNAAAASITTLEPPKNLKVKIEKDSNNKPYFQLDWDIPQSISDANKVLPVYHIVDFKIGDGKWLSESVTWDGLPIAYSSLLTNTYVLDPVEEDIVDKVVIEENVYYFRVAFVCKETGGNPIVSNYSNVVSTKVPAYSDASPWAQPELEKADDLGLITDTLRGEDMTRPITREEFAETAVKFYEMVTGKKAEPHPTKIFLDCDNIEVLKALNLNITAGVGDGTKFEPDSYLLRQQMAAMITRTLTACYDGLTLDVSGQPDFLDQKDFAGYAIIPAKFMAKYKITVGDGKGNFVPNNNCLRQEAFAFLLRSYLNGDQYLK
jgi:hypothetical protein